MTRCSSSTEMMASIAELMIPATRISLSRNASIFLRSVMSLKRIATSFRRFADAPGIHIIKAMELFGGVLKANGFAVKAI